MKPYLSDKAVKDIERKFDDTRRAWEILAIIVGEWESDPMSVQCFDLRIVDEAKKLVAAHRARGEL